MVGLIIIMICKLNITIFQVGMKRLFKRFEIFSHNKRQNSIESSLG